MNERTHFFIKIYLTLYSWKGCKRVDVGYVWEVSWRQRETATYWPQVPLTIAALLPHSAGLLNQGHWGPKPLCLELVLTPQVSYLQLELNWNWLELTNRLTQAICGTWLYNCLTPTCFCGHTHLHQIQPRSQVKVIFQYLQPDAPVIYTGASLDWWLG